MPTAYAWIDRALDTIHRANWHRSVQSIESQCGAVIKLNGQQMINFASNDYLGLASDERLIQAAIAAAQTYGTGSTGSRLLSGHRDLHRELEQAIADLKHTEAAIVFSSGYLANLGTVSALVGKRDLILSDQYNHASLIKGAILSGATRLDYNHCNTQHLHALLDQHRAAYRRCLILTDSVFSMDGDLCPLPAILDLADQFECMVLVDEAHSTGVLGETGAGCVEQLGCGDRSLIQMGTLSKALGSLGGYVAGSAALIDFLRNRASSWIYTTALSPPNTAAALTAIRIVQQEPQRRAQLWQNVSWLKQALAQTLWQPVKHQRINSTVSPPASCLLPFASPIFCLPVDAPATVLQLGTRLQARGLFVSAVRPPTVPTSRLRITVMATHQQNHLEQLVQELQQESLWFEVKA